MKKILFVLTSAALVFTACQKEENAADNGEGMFLTATVEQQVEGTETKSSLDGTSVKWTAGDEIKLFDNTGIGAKLIASSTGVSSGFTEPSPTAREDDFDETNPSCAIYPYSAAKSCDGTNITFTLPATQTYAENSFGPDANVAVGTFSDKSVAFKNVCGVFKLSIKGDITVQKIVLSGKNNEKLNGEYTVAASTFTCNCATTTETSEKTLTLDCSSNGETSVGAKDGGVTLSSGTATTFYFVVPVGAFGDDTNPGFTATVYEKGTTTTYNLGTTSKNIISRSCIKAMPNCWIVDGGVYVLPSAYQEVEYLKTGSASEGKPYINTGYKWKTDNIKYELEMMQTDIAQSSTGLFGSQQKGADTNWAIQFWYSGKGTYVSHFIGTSASIAGWKTVLNTKYHFIGEAYSDHTWKITINETQKSGIWSGSIGDVSVENENVGLFTLANDYGFTARIINNFQVYYFKMTDNGTLVRYFIPAKCKSGNKYIDGNTGEEIASALTSDKPGMYDLVSGRFFVNQNTGNDFTTGSAVTH